MASVIVRLSRRLVGSLTVHIHCVCPLLHEEGNFYKIAENCVEPSLSGTIICCCGLAKNCILEFFSTIIWRHWLMLVRLHLDIHCAASVIPLIKFDMDLIRLRVHREALIGIT